MPGLDRLSETFMLPWWAAVAAALLVAVLAVLAALRNEWPKTVGSPRSIRRSGRSIICRLDFL
jgi:hypothetical protein